MRLVRSASIGGKEHWYFVAVVDVSVFPTERAAEVTVFLQHVGNLIDDVLRRMGVKSIARSTIGSATQLAIVAKHAPRAARLIEEHERWIAAAPVFSRLVPPPFEEIARAGEAMLSS